MFIDADDRKIYEVLFFLTLPLERHLSQLRSIELENPVNHRQNMTLRYHKTEI